MIRYRTTWGVVCQFVMCFFIILASCKESKDNKDSLADYYLPYESFPPGGTRYTYRNLVDTSLDREIWEHIMTSEGHITSINYDHRQQVVQKQYERIVPNGVLIDSLVLYYQEDSGVLELPVRVISPHRFPYLVEDTSQVWLTHLEWHQPEDSLHVVLERRRKFAGDTTWIYEGKQVPAVRFKTIDKFETELDGWTTSEWTGEEVYAKNIGLVYYIRNISKHLRLEFELESRKAL